MSFFADVCDAWASELRLSIPELDQAVYHLYGSWNPELMYAEAGERHVAVFPNGEPEVAEGLTVTGDDLAAQTYTILVWEDTSGDAERLVENPDIDQDWLELYEAIRDRFYLSTNGKLGSSDIMATRYIGGSFDRSGQIRAMELRFVVRVPHTYIR